MKSNPQGNSQAISPTIDMTMSGLDIGKSFYDAESGSWPLAQYTADPATLDISLRQITTVVARRDL